MVDSFQFKRRRWTHIMDVSALVTNHHHNPSLKDTYFQVVTCNNCGQSTTRNSLYNHLRVCPARRPTIGTQIGEFINGFLGGYGNRMQTQRRPQRRRQNRQQTPYDMPTSEARAGVVPEGQHVATETMSDGRENVPMITEGVVSS